MTPLEKIIDHHKYLPQYLRYRANFIDITDSSSIKNVIKMYLAEGILLTPSQYLPMEYDEFVSCTF